ncbi:MAG TPA: family 78 glycoside hydrolase catalytic domain [Microbacterium sp.]|nr:family 78 glycoside hydrolase catalytic domain [Microbacterium sp.]
MTDMPMTFIAPAERGPTDRVVRLATTFDLVAGHGGVERATLFFTALGVVEPYVNDRPATTALLTPGWSSYEWRLRVAETPVEGLTPTGNRLALRLAPGWYAGRLGWQDGRALYGDRPAAAARLAVTYGDGHVQVVETNEMWSWGEDRTRSADLYDGETIDARIVDPPLDGAVEPVAYDGSLERYTSPPVVRQETLSAVAVTRSPSGKLLVDFGQNLVGVTRLSVRGDAGAEIRIRHAEVLENGELGTRPLRSARATDTYILSGDDDVFEPSFTFHGFRYVEVEGWPHADDDLFRALTATVIGSGLRRTGSFRSSHALLNRFADNVAWGMRGNFVDVPTDCPQRDERLGWTGDIAAFAPTAVFLFDAQDFLSEWLRDVEAETFAAGGIVPFVVPDSLKRESAGTPAPPFGSPLPTALWGDAAVWVPWAMFQHDGDRDRLASHAGLMRAHGDAVARVLEDDGTWRAGFQFGDWLDPAAPPEDPAAARTPTALVATACAFRTFTILAETEEVLGDRAAAARFRDLAARVRSGFAASFVDADGIAPATATGCALAIAFGLVDGADRDRAGEQLATIVRGSGHRIDTGFAGTPFVTDALTLTGHVDDAYRLLLQTECPSWLYPVTMGATTVWERWDSMLPDGSINPGEMTSFNHYALGAVADWMHRTVGGIAPAEPGYRRVLIAPVPGPGIDHAETSLDSPAGRVSVSWRVSGDTLALTAEVPTPAVVRIPGAAAVDIAPGRHELEFAWPA